MPTTSTGTATKPASSLGVPTPGGDTDTWGDYLVNTTFPTLIGWALYLLARIPRSELDVNQTAHGFAAGDVLRHDGSGWVASTADTAANAIVAGIVSVVTDVDNFAVVLAGQVDTLGGLTAGTLYYLQDAGGLGTTPGTVTVGVLLADSATSGILVAIGGGGGGGSATSPLTTKGDVWGFDTADARIPVGTDGQVLTADSVAGVGVSWQTPAAGGGSGTARVVSEQTLAVAAASITIDLSSYTDDELEVWISGAWSNGLAEYAILSFNGDTTDANYKAEYSRGGAGVTNTDVASRQIGVLGDTDRAGFSFKLTGIQSGRNARLHGTGQYHSGASGYTTEFANSWSSTAQVTSITIGCVGGAANFAAGARLLAINPKGDATGQVALWPTYINSPGSTVAPFTADSGTWTSDGTVIITPNSGTGWKNLVHNTPRTGVPFTYEAEILLPSAGQTTGNIYTGICPSIPLTGGTGKLMCGLKRTGGTWAYEVEKEGVTVITNGAFSGALDTWYKLKVVVIGDSYTFFIDDVPIYAGSMGAAGSSAWSDLGVGLAIGTGDNVAHIRNILVNELSTESGSVAPATVNAYTGIAETLALADAEAVCTFDNASPITVTVPPNSSVPFPIGTTIALYQIGAGQVTLAAGAGVTINSPGSLLSISSQNQVVGLLKIATDTWQLTGALA